MSYDSPVAGAARRFAWKAPLKALRSSQPFNFLATHLLRSLLAARGKSSEWLIRHVHRVGGVSTDLPNGRTLRLWSRGDDWVSNQIFWRGWAGYEPETTPLFFRLAEQAAFTVDVGAYVGYFTLLAAHANPAGRVLAIEPLATIHERLVRHVALNGLTNVECVMAAAGAQEGTAAFYHQPHDLPTSSSLSREFMKGVENLTATSVPVVVVDRMLRDRGVRRVDLVKLDTETTEPDVLAGMRETLIRDRPWIVCEVLKGRGAEARLQSLLEPLGYRFYLLTPDGPVLRETIEGHPTWLNYLFAARPEEFSRGLTLRRCQ